MAEEKVEPREMNWRQLLPWTELFRGFQVALDLNKLALAAAGILVMAFGWWLLAVLFTAGETADSPQWPGVYKSRNPDNEREAWKQFKQDRDHWNLMHEAANLGRPNERVQPEDLVASYDEYLLYTGAVAAYEKATDQRANAAAALNEALSARKAAAAKVDQLKNKPDDVEAKDARDKLIDADKKLADAEKYLRDQKIDDLVKLMTDEKLKDDKKTPLLDVKARELAALYLGDLGRLKPYATLATWPWYEDRGPNPFLLATGQLGKPWEIGHFWEWLMTKQAPVLLEPVVKLLLPIIYFFSPSADLKCRIYFLCVLLWTVLTWSVFGGAITRIAAVQVARGEKIGLFDALQFVRKRILSYLTAPLFPLLFVLVLLVVMFLFGLPYLIPIFGDILVAGLFWPVMIVVGLLMAITLVGLVGWPLMSATVSAEGTDSWEAVSRAYSYVYQKPWHFIWYVLVALAYGAVVVFFIGFIGSLTIYLTKWGVSTAPDAVGLNHDGRNRQPNFLFVYAPSSFGWRGLLMQGAELEDGEKIVDAEGRINQPAYDKWVGRDDSYKGSDKLEWWNLFGAFLVGVWLWIMFMLILGFSYSYFWSASTITYMLLRRNVDTAEMDEVYLEEDEGEGAFGAPLTTTPSPSPAAIKPGTTNLTMVDAPSLRPPPAAPPPALPVTEAPPVPPGPPSATDGGPIPRSEVGMTPTEPGA